MQKKKHACGLHCMKVQNLSVRFHDVDALWDVNLHIHCGSLNVVIGRNGAGKSTLIRAILGDVPHTGTIEFKNDENGSPQHLKIGYVPQRINIEENSPISVYDLFASFHDRFPLFLTKRKQSEEKFLSALQIFEAEDLIDRQLCKLSGGQLQRVMLALAIVDEPNLLLLDEPVSGIDHNGMDLFYHTLLRLKEEFDLSIILISHDLEHVRAYANHVILLDHTVIRQGTPEEVFSSIEFQRTFGKESERS
ncbi:MAG: metal ABC transporter ATP-binding protein [Lachnospiraceae bacterium]